MIKKRDLHRLLKDKGIKYLYHANSVATSLTFLYKEGLLSRGAVDSLDLFQTRQSSDSLDKKYKVWNDIFLDTHDLHSAFGRQNYYGPVVFKISIDFLLTTKFDVKITKDNPVHWKSESKNSDRYFRNATEVRETWKEYDFQKRMITLSDNQRPALFNHVKEIILDSPERTIGVNDLFKGALRDLRKASRTGRYVKISKRQCDSCYCVENYSKYSTLRLKKMFQPTTI